jgi:quercetin 2,3-dioxygenase
MKSLRRSDERGLTKLTWLESRHTFSFGDYRDPDHDGFANLRVINDDLIAPGAGFGLHPHRDMEIVTYQLAGALRHRDSLGNEDVLRAGEVQRMSAGRGIVHAEHNASPTESCALLQIWILPAARGADPSYEQRAFAPEERRNRWRTLVAPDRRDGALWIGADAALDAVSLDSGAELVRPLEAGRPHWMHVAKGAVHLGAIVLLSGDAVALTDESSLLLRAEADSDVLLFALAAS